MKAGRDGGRDGQAHDVIAWLLTHEAWRIIGEEARRYNQSEDNDRKVKDIAGSQEMRVLAAADRAGHLYLVQQFTAPGPWRSSSTGTRVLGAPCPTRCTPRSTRCRRLPPEPPRRCTPGPGTPVPSARAGPGEVMNGTWRGAHTD